MINVHSNLIREELPKIGVDAFAVLMCITSHINKRKTAWPGIERLRKMTGLSKERTYRAISTLIEMGHIQRKQMNTKGNFGHTVYRLTTKYLSVFVGVSEFELPDSNIEPYAGNPEHGYPEYANPESGKAARISIDESGSIDKDEVLENGKSARENSTTFHVELHSLETIPNEGDIHRAAPAPLAESWQPAAAHLIALIEANPDTLRMNLRGMRALPTDWKEKVRERMRYFQGNGEWALLTIPSDLNGRRRKWEAQMCAKVAAWIDSPYNSPAPAANSAPAKTFREI